ncbi:MAG: TetR family transcriptional regulator [Pseudomonadota bacterium]
MQSAEPAPPTRRDARAAATRARILSRAGRLFYARGLLATGVDAIAAELGISKRTLYNHFPSKDALVLAYLEASARPAEESDAPALDQILAAFDRLAEAVDRGRFRGCPFVNAVTELGPDHPAAAVARRFKAARRDRLTALLARAGARTPESLGPRIALLFEGAMATALVSGDADGVRAARQDAQDLIASHMPRASPGAP